MPWTVLGRVNLHAPLIHTVVSRSSPFTTVPRASRNFQFNGNLLFLNCLKKFHWSSRPPFDASKTINVNDKSQSQVRNYWKMSVQGTIDDLTQVCIDLRQSVKKASSQEQKEAIALKHIKTYAGTGLKINDFAKGIKRKSEDRDTPKKTNSKSTPKKDDCLLTEDEKVEYVNFMEIKESLEKELTELKTNSELQDSMKEVMELLHEYNDIKDATQTILGALATMRGVTVASLHEEYNLPLKDE